MATKKELKSGQIARIAGKIPLADLKMVVVIYRMGITQSDLDNITSYSTDEQGAIRKILQMWSYKKSGTPQVMKTL